MNLSLARLENENFEDYKLRRANVNFYLKNLSRPKKLNLPLDKNGCYVKNPIKWK